MATGIINLGGQTRNRPSGQTRVRPKTSTRSTVSVRKAKNSRRTVPARRPNAGISGRRPVRRAARSRTGDQNDTIRTFNVEWF